VSQGSRNKPLALRDEGVAAGSRLLGAAEALLARIGGVLDMEYRLIYERAVAAARAQLGEEAFLRACQEGQAMSLEEFIEDLLEV
jgi:hypothetical protein